MRAKYILVIALLGLYGCTSWERFDGYIPAAPSPSIIKSAQVSNFTKKFSTLKLQRVDEFVSPGSLTGKSTLFSTITLSVDEYGKTKEFTQQQWGPFENGKPTGVSEIQQVSVCGLQILSREIKARTIMAYMSSASFNRTEGEIERSSLERLVVDSLSSEMSGICKPKTGSIYEYQVSSQAQIRWSEMQNNRRVLTSNNKCITENSKVSAGGIIPGVEGEALKVSCTATYKDGSEHISRYAFFEVLGIYMPLEVDEPERERKTAYRYSNVVIGQ